MGDAQHGSSRGWPPARQLLWAALPARWSRRRGRLLRCVPRERVVAALSISRGEQVVEHRGRGVEIRRQQGACMRGADVHRSRDQRSAVVDHHGEDEVAVLTAGRGTAEVGNQRQLCLSARAYQAVAQQGTRTPCQRRSTVR